MEPEYTSHDLKEKLEKAHSYIRVGRAKLFDASVVLQDDVFLECGDPDIEQMRNELLSVLDCIKEHPSMITSKINDLEIDEQKAVMTTAINKMDEETFEKYRPHLNHIITESGVIFTKEKA